MHSTLITQHSTHPYVIAGPCSAETEAQVMETALALKAGGRVAAFRAGVWKPRTRPGGFQGLGTVALPWLKRVQEEVGLPVITEVARPEHIQACLKAGIKMFWIGARTTVNPFVVQELAEAIAGNDVAVLVKNPVSPDLGLWIGALERFAAVGITKLGAIHRGFSQYQPGQYRNPPEWFIAIELRNRVPEIPLLCDPSHITGKRELVPFVAQTALDLGYDGLMIETHPNPPQALSDARQQITPAELDDFLHHASLTPLRPAAETTDELEEVRRHIDEADADVVEALARRFALVKQAGAVKRDHHLMILQMERWRKVLLERTAQAEKLGLDAMLVRRLYELIHAESVRLQEEVVRGSLVGSK